MKDPNTLRDVEQAVRALTFAEKTSLGIEVTLPIIYPTGENVAVVIERGESESLVHDSGFGSMCLTSEGILLSTQIRHCKQRHYSHDKHCPGRMSPGRMSLVSWLLHSRPLILLLYGLVVAANSINT